MPPNKGMVRMASALRAPATEGQQMGQSSKFQNVGKELISQQGLRPARKNRQVKAMPVM